MTRIVITQGLTWNIAGLPGSAGVRILDSSPVRQQVGHWLGVMDGLARSVSTPCSQWPGDGHVAADRAGRIRDRRRAVLPGGSRARGQCASSVLVRSRSRRVPAGEIRAARSSRRDLPGRALHAGDRAAVAQRLTRPRFSAARPTSIARTRALRRRRSGHGSARQRWWSPTFPIRLIRWCVAARRLPCRESERLRWHRYRSGHVGDRAGGFAAQYHG